MIFKLHHQPAARKTPGRFLVRVTRTQKGFTLIEAFVAITILLMSMVGPLAIASQSAVLSAFTRDQVTANFLAQDAIEYIRWIRDTNQLSANPGGWLAGLTPCVGGGATTCYFDSSFTDPWSANKPQSCSGVCPAMHYDTTSGLYNYGGSGGTNGLSNFTRTVSMILPIAPNDCSAGKGCEASIIAQVSWKTGTLTHSVSAEEHLMPWVAGL